MARLLASSFTCLLRQSIWLNHLFVHQEGQRLWNMVELESRMSEQSAESAIENASGNSNLKNRTLKQDATSRILLTVIAICGFGVLLLLALALAAAMQGVLGSNLPGATPVGKPIGSGSVALVLTIILVITALVSYFILRRRVLENSMLYTDAGCPQCWENELVRVRRHKPDRVIARFGIPVRRYKCRNCDWAGLRLGGQPPGTEIKTEAAPADIFWGSDDMLGVQQGESAVRKNH